MRKKTQFKLAKILLIALLTQIFLIEAIQAQSQRPIPKMWVSKKVSDEREILFGLKKGILDLAIGGNHPTRYFFTIESIEKLIEKIESNYTSSMEETGIRVYFGAPKVEQGERSALGSIKKNQIVLIFAPTEKKKDLGKYYAINKDLFTVNDITLKIKKDWIDNYVDNIIGNESKGLATTIDREAEENYVSEKLSDTRSIYYSYKNFIEFMKTEKDHQDGITPSNKISGYRFYFAAINSSGIDCDDHHDHGKFKHRLLLIVEFTKKKNGNHVKFHIDDARDFDRRERPKCASGDKQSTTGGDNGQLCPPNCPEEG